MTLLNKLMQEAQAAAKVMEDGAQPRVRRRLGADGRARARREGALPGARLRVGPRGGERPRARRAAGGRAEGAAPGDPDPRRRAAGGGGAEGERRLPGALQAAGPRLSVGALSRRRDFARVVSE